MNNEEKILEILEQHSSMLEHQFKVLEQHTKLFETIQTDLADMKTDISDLRDRVVKIEVTQENVVLPHLQALAEGQTNLLATLAPKNRVEALEDEMAFMKSVIKAMSQEIAELKKA